MNKIFVILIVGFFSFFNVQSPVNQKDSSGKKQGEWTKKWSNNKVKYTGKFKNDKPVGEFIRYNKKGQMTSKLFYFGDSGLKASAYIYYPKGGIEAIGNYNSQKKDSLWKFFTEENILIAERFYSKGVFHGKTKEYYKSGKLKIDKEYKMGILIGPYLEYFENGELLTKTTYVNGNPTGSFSTYWPNKVPRIRGKYKNGSKIGTWKFYSSKAKLEKEEIFDNGKLIYTSNEIVTYWNDSLEIVRTKENYSKDGRSSFTEFYPNGSVYRKGFYYKGRKDSVWTYSTQAGRMDTVRTFYRGSKHGHWTIKHNNGKVKVEKSFFKNKLEGTYKEFYSNGKLKITGEYKNGQRFGPWKYYNKEGEVVRTLNNK